VKVIRISMGSSSRFTKKELKDLGSVLLNLVALSAGLYLPLNEGKIRDYLGELVRENPIEYKAPVITVPLMPRIDPDPIPELALSWNYIKA